MTDTPDLPTDDAATPDAAAGDVSTITVACCWPVTDFYTPDGVRITTTGTPVPAADLDRIQAAAEKCGVRLTTTTNQREAT